MNEAISIFHKMNNMPTNVLMDFKTIEAAESALAKGERVELIPVKDGVKVVRVRRDEVKNDR